VEGIEEETVRTLQQVIESLRTGLEASVQRQRTTPVEALGESEVDPESEISQVEAELLINEDILDSLMQVVEDEILRLEELVVRIETETQ
jgi:hypothetical protein